MNVKVADIMTREPITIKPETNLFECAKKMVRKRVGSLLIVDKKRLVGFISQRDILWALVKKSKADLSKIRAIDISPKKIATIKPNAKILEAKQKMNKTKFERLPVVYEKELIGMITIKDILNFNPELYTELDEYSKIREEAEKLKRVQKVRENIQEEGICSECGNQNLLFEVGGVLICEGCRNSRE